jgi:hypothetical protein
MSAATMLAPKKHVHRKVVRRGSSSDTFYGIGLIGAWVYYFQRAKTNDERIKAFFKGLVWPAFLVHDLFVFLKKEPPTPQ